MNRKVLILNVAKSDFREIKSYVRTQFGESVWKEVNQEFQNTIRNIGLNAEAGQRIEELGELGQDNFKTRLVRQTKIVYAFDEREVLVHMFIHEKRDFRTHLLKRLLSM
ncbi:MAG: type II toxin-antitoxin system RelE/ParE family toxin [Burkholderiales bacterium]|jgi:plasmid stabilization system protein ParE|nr:type II toxin-antitoxin system RelE/ParE family toxin [Burkholderiales bacterium]